MPPLPSDPLLARQWSLHGNGLPQPAVHLNVLPAWEDYAGSGVSVGVYDSLVEATHPDLAAGYDATWEVAGLEYGFTGSAHGTEVAGVIAARANGIGSVGVAHAASITSLPVIFSKTVSMQWLEPAMAQAWRFDVTNMSFGGTVAFDALQDPGQYAPILPHYVTAAETGRGGLGTVMVVAAGNNRALSTDANLSWYQTQRHTLVVGAVNTAGMVSEYASPGANLLVVAPSSDGFGSPGVTTTDRSGLEGVNDGITGDPVPLEYTTRFGGTSAAAPMVAGVAALMLEANPALGWRDVREILALSARHTGTPVGQAASLRERTPWFVNAGAGPNGAGFHVSANYGFGLVDARAAVRLAEHWDARQTSANEQARTAAVSGPLVLDNANTARELLLEIAPGLRAEQVTLALDLTGMPAQDLEIVLTSPRGTASTLFFHSGAVGGSISVPVAFRPWTFVSNAFLGEDATGTWRLSLKDTYANASTGTINAAVLSVFGDAAGPDDRHVFTDAFQALPGMAHAATLADTGGTDTLDGAALTGRMLLDLRPGHGGTLGAKPLALAPGTWIEHAIGGDADDRLAGNEAANHLRGGRGNDALLGAGGDDTLEGGAGRDGLDGGPGHDILRGGAGIDVLRGRAGDDTLEGGAGDDWIEGGAGADMLQGGPGLDALSYAASPAAVAVALGVLGPGGRHSVSGGHAEGDQATGFEHLTGSRFADTLAGDARRNHIAGGGGGDTLSGGAGDDIFIFGPNDLLAPAARILDFRPAAAPGAERDTLSLRAIDAVAGGADDAFRFIAALPFAAPGELRAWFDGTDTLIEGNTAAGPDPELRIRLAGADWTSLLGTVDFAL